jgi:hypothetical protein
MPAVSLTALEAAINWWKQAHPADARTCALAPPVAALAKPYALMVWQHRHSMEEQDLSQAAQQALAAWRAAGQQTP